MGDRRGDPGGVRVESVVRGSAADAAGIRTGDRILSVSRKPVRDLLDLYFLTGSKRFALEWVGRDGSKTRKVIRTDAKPLGISPEPVRVRRCRNRCLFCFVHQLPRGLRKSLYVKDEDVRLSFLHGQYVTLSDIDDDEMARILRYGLSPLYVSIHATDTELRRKMLGNSHARDVTSMLKRLVGGGITVHGQIVVCPGINDGHVLERTLTDLTAFRPGLATVAVVPVGLTSHRAGLPVLKAVSRAEASSTIDLVERFRVEAGENRGEPFAMAADEYYQLARRKVPGRRIYGSFVQIENGVGLIRRFIDDTAAFFRRKNLGRRQESGVVATGTSASGYVDGFLKRYSDATGGRFETMPVPNRLMGRSVTVTGLVSGGDILLEAKKRRTKRLFIPSVMLRDGGDLFLDGATPESLSRSLGAEVVLFDPTPSGFHDAVLQGKRPSFR